MSNVNVTVSVPKEFNDVMAALVQLVVAVKAGKADLGTELGVLIPVVGELNVALGEITSMPLDCVLAASIQGVALAKALLAPTLIPV